MATRSRTTFQKRQKELARQERQRAKAARRQDRKLHKVPGLPEIAPFDDEDAGLPADDNEPDTAANETQE
jgi:hypothetical protein